jgi:hypothetical protein
MPLFRPARGRRRPNKRARTPTAPPVDPHRFVGNGERTWRGVEGCALCPFPAGRTDIHTSPKFPDAGDDAAALTRRITGDRE